MHHAPSVSYPVGRSFWAAGLMGVVWSAGALAGVAWLGGGAPGWAPAALGAALLGSGAAAVQAWRTQPSGLLAWDGGRWTLACGPGPEPGPGRIEVALDLQGLLLVRWAGQDGAQWLWLERGRLPARWDALRRAVYSPAEPDPSSAAEPPSA
ncbi:MAG: hypothetical protein EOO24_52200 [Comamonadaceae bacterium]|nr:MAG: hypothetical protein EOO24_52200 [Comamonadaceae bacterium]